MIDRKMMSKFKFLIKVIKKKLLGYRYKKILPLLYFSFILLGIVLTFFYAFYPTLTTCSSLFGRYFCTPLGIYIALFVSLPGYIISGNAISFVDDLPLGISFILVIGSSALFYFLLGTIIDNFKNKPLNTENITKILLIVFFSILSLFFISLI